MCSFLFDMVGLYHSVRFMKKKPFRKRSKILAKRTLKKIGPAPTSAPSAQVVSLQPGSPIMPDPERLFREAEGEPDLRTLSAYVDSIRILRDKGFSYREIADWLSERGIEVDHNSVYRAYTKSLSDYEVKLEDLREADDAEQEARRNA
jgi:hypothetical protein